jgi:FAD/FMN-containing dehydrogenase
MVVASPAAGGVPRQSRPVEPRPVSGRDLASLREGLSGPVYEPGDDGFGLEQAGSYRGPVYRPAAVIAARHRGDVQAAVRFAAEHGIPVAVQATGHGSSPPTDGALLISTRRMRTLTIDPAARTARIGAGVVWRDVLDAAARHGLGSPCASSPGVGAVGFTLGGGLSPTGRTHGYAADHVRSCELVSADGEVHEVNAACQGELFWALRGGTGSFGVVTALELDLFAEPALYGGGLFYRGEDAGAVLRAYLRWAPTLPEAMTTSVALRRDDAAVHVAGTPGGEGVVHLRVAHLGEAVAGHRLLAPMRAAARPIADTLSSMPFSAVGDIYEEPSTPVRGEQRSALLADLTDAGVAELLGTVERERDAVFSVEIRALGGALRRPPKHACSVDHRDAAYLVYVQSLPSEGSLEAGAAHRLLDAIADEATGGVAPNFLGSAIDPGEVAAGWSPATHRRLVELKRQWDPADLFRFGHPLLPAPTKVSPDGRRVLRHCGAATSVAELAATLALPLGVVRVVLTDLAEAGLVEIHRIAPEQANDATTLEEVLDGLRQRL